eukprot:gene17876-21317_t
MTNSSFWKAFKTIFITFGSQHTTTTGDKRKVNSRKQHKHIDYSPSIIDDSYLNNAPQTPAEHHQQQQILQQKRQQQQESIPTITINSCSPNTKPDQTIDLNCDHFDESVINWPQWALSLQERCDMRPISRNGLDVDEIREANGFKGRNYVYQDRKFVTKYYWKGHSTIFPTDTTIISPSRSHHHEQPEFNIRDIDGGDLQFSIDSNDQDRMLIGAVFWNTNCEGPPGCVHGGALASLFDDSMACCIRYYYNKPPKKYAVTANLSVNYKKFVPLSTVSLIETKIEKKEGKKIFVTSVIKDQNGTIRAEATAVWIVVNMHAPSSSSTSFPSSPFKDLSPRGSPP